MLPTIVYPVAAVRLTGEVILFADEAALLRGYRTLPGTVGLSHVVLQAWINASRAPVVTHHDWVLRDDHGAKVAPAELAAVARLRRGSHVPLWWRRLPQVPRGYPVPGTGQRRRGHYFRHPQTFNELRANAGLHSDVEELSDRLRCVRARHDVPTAWDDRARNRERGWKSQRRTQWKAAD